MSLVDRYPQMAEDSPRNWSYRWAAWCGWWAWTQVLLKNSNCLLTTESSLRPPGFISFDALSPWGTRVLQATCGVEKCWGYLLLFVGGFLWLPFGHYCPRGSVMSFPELFYRPRDGVEAPGVTLKVLWLHSYSPFLFNTWPANRAQMFKHYTRKLLSLDLVKNFSHPIQSGCFCFFIKQWPQPPEL